MNAVPVLFSLALLHLCYDSPAARRYPPPSQNLPEGTESCVRALFSATATPSASSTHVNLHASNGVTVTDVKVNGVHRRWTALNGSNGSDEVKLEISPAAGVGDTVEVDGEAPTGTTGNLTFSA
jgi:hypothetical protein